MMDNQISTHSVNMRTARREMMFLGHDPHTHRCEAGGGLGFEKNTIPHKDSLIGWETIVSYKRCNCPRSWHLAFVVIVDMRAIACSVLYIRL